jgi:hypothetical protein
MAEQKERHDSDKVYRAVTRMEVARAVAGAAVSPFAIEVRFLGGLSERQRDAFRAAADRWTRIIVADLPAVMVEGELIDDVLILAQGRAIDGPSGILGQAGPTHLRPAGAGAAAFLPARGRMSFDTADLEEMERNGTLNDVITHEMGHVLGIGTIWTDKGLLRGVGTSNPTFVGPNAMVEYGVLRGTGPTEVPVENEGGAGTRDSHWRERLFQNELMSGIIRVAGNPISRVTVASLSDLGYTVDMNAAEPFNLPNLMQAAEEGLLVAAAFDEGVVLPNIPTVLPEESMQL